MGSKPWLQPAPSYVADEGRRMIADEAQEEEAPERSRLSPLSHGRSILSSRVSLVFSLVLIASLVAVVFNLSSNNRLRTSNIANRSAQIYTIKVVNEFPHDPKAFTQGLLYGGNDTLFESTGLNGKSPVRKVALQTGKPPSLRARVSSSSAAPLLLRTTPPPPLPAAVKYSWWIRL